jgi:hypothetical protein
MTVQVVVRASWRTASQLACALNEVDDTQSYSPIPIGYSQLSAWMTAVGLTRIQHSRAVELHCLSLMPHCHYQADATGSREDASTRSRPLPEYGLALPTRTIA